MKDTEKAVAVLRSGGTILYPTDTVWGIGCDAGNREAVERIYQIKKRNEKQSMLVLVSDVDMLYRYVRQVPDIALQLLDVADKPLSIIYPDAENLAANIIADDGSVGIRAVKDDFCRQLIRTFGKPIVSTSANISGEKTPAVFAEISEEIKKAVDYVVLHRQNDRQPAKASSIIKLNADGTIRIIRP